jgi:hypothetical protein
MSPAEEIGPSNADVTATTAVTTSAELPSASAPARAHRRGNSDSVFWKLISFTTFYTWCRLARTGYSGWHMHLCFIACLASTLTLSLVAKKDSRARWRNGLIGLNRLVMLTLMPDAEAMAQLLGAQMLDMPPRVGFLGGLHDVLYVLLGE